MQTESGDLSAKSKVLANLGLNAHQAGSQELALQYLSEALELAIQLGMKDEQAYTLTCLGNVLHALHREEDAMRSFRDGLALRRSLGQTQQAMSDLAGLAQLAVVAGDLAQAHAYADEMVPVLTQPGFAVAVEFLRVYWDCYTALVATGDPRARALLVEARQRLMRRAEQIDSDELRQSYLGNVRVHRSIQEECSRVGVDDANP
jgi:tetratricopeptide (TPR) repeat protein